MLGLAEEIHCDPVRIGLCESLDGGQIRRNRISGERDRTLCKADKRIEKAFSFRGLIGGFLEKSFCHHQLAVAHSVFRPDFGGQLGKPVPETLFGELQICLIIVLDDLLSRSENGVRLQVHSGLLDQLQQDMALVLVGIADQRKESPDSLFVVLFAEHGDFAGDSALHRECADDIEEEAVERADLQFFRGTENLLKDDKEILRSRPRGQHSGPDLFPEPLRISGKSEDLLNDFIEDLSGGLVGKGHGDDLVGFDAELQQRQIAHGEPERLSGPGGSHNGKISNRARHDFSPSSALFFQTAEGTALRRSGRKIVWKSSYLTF